MSKIKINSWIKASRLRTLPLALSSTLMGSALAIKCDAFDWTIFGLAVLTTILLQVLSNYANDYGDYKNGADVVGERSDRMLASGAITEDQMRRGLVITSVFAFVSGCSLLYVSFSLGQIVQVAMMLVVGVGAIWAALKYTAGNNPYGYRGLGDVFVFLFFGLVGVLGTKYLYAQEIVSTDFLYALVIGLLSVAVLNLNNLRDIISDKASGKITIPVRLGFKKAKKYHLSLFVLAWLCVGVIGFMNITYSIGFVVPILVLHVAHLLLVQKCTEPKALDPELKKIALSTFVIALFFFVNAFI